MEFNSLRRPDIGFLPTPVAVVEASLAIAKLTSTDRLYDLGCGDGRILITAAERWGIRGIGIDIDPLRVQEAQQNAQQAGVGDRLSFYHQDLYTTDFSAATVVFLYLLPHLNLRLRPQLFRQLQPGSRVISHDFDMGDWRPEQVMQVPMPDGDATLYRWTIPELLPAHLRSPTETNTNP